MPAEWDAARPGADVVAALVESEKVRREDGVKLPSAELGECEEGMREAVPRPREREGGGVDGQRFMMSWTRRIVSWRA